jgi:hypothetical protein
LNAICDDVQNGPLPQAVGHSCPPSAPAASRQLCDFTLDRFLNDYLGGFIRLAGAAFRAHGRRDAHATEDVSLAGPLVERDFLHFSDDHSAIADVADVGIVRIRHFPQICLFAQPMVAEGQPDLGLRL